MANNVTLPKRTTIEGQPHKLAYITPQEGDLLKRMGGSGQMHRGIPSYPPAGDAGGTGSGQAGTSSGVGGFGAGSPSGQAAAAAQGFQAAMAAEAQAQAAAQQQMAQRAEEAKSYAAAQQLANIATQRAMTGAQLTSIMPARAVYNFLTATTPEQIGLASASKFLSMPNVSLSSYGVPTAPISGGGRVTMNRFGGVTYTGMPQEGYEGAYANLIAPKPDIGGGRPQQVAPVQDPMTGQERCPEGYYFNETLQACIMDTRSTSPFQPEGSMGVAEMSPPTGYYARMSLLDQPPAGLLEAGFGSPQDFAAANTAFRRGAATRPSMYTDPYNLQGYTLLS